MTITVTGGAAWPASDGGTHLLATGTAGQTIRWADYGPPMQVHSFSLNAPNLSAYEPAPLRDGGVLVPYFNGSDAGMVFIGEAGAYGQPYNNPMARAPTGRVLVAVTDTSIFLAWEAGGGAVELFHFTPGNPDSDGRTEPAGSDLVGLAASDDQHVFVVSHSQTVPGIDVFPIVWNAGFGVNVRSISTDPVLESVALLSDNVLAFAAVCKVPGGICPDAGYAFIGFYKP
jgi:hypothetical protein